jgi:hypothetical protein
MTQARDPIASPPAPGSCGTIKAVPPEGASGGGVSWY